MQGINHTFIYGYCTGTISIPTSLTVIKVCRDQRISIRLSPLVYRWSERRSGTISRGVGRPPPPPPPQKVVENRGATISELEVGTLQWISADHTSFKLKTFWCFGNWAYQYSIYSSCSPHISTCLYKPDDYQKNLSDLNTINSHDWRSRGRKNVQRYRRRFIFSPVLLWNQTTFCKRDQCLKVISGYPCLLHSPCLPSAANGWR